MRHRKRVMATACAVVVGIALAAGVASPASASVLATASGHPAATAAATSRTVTATVSPTPYKAEVFSVFPGYDTTIDGSIAVISVPAGSTRMTFDLGADAARMQLPSLEYWAGTVAKPVHGTATVEQQGSTVSIDVPADTFAVGDTDAYFDLEAKGEPAAGTLLPPAGYTTGYTFYAAGALKVTAPAAPSTLELPVEKASYYNTDSSYWAAPDSTRALNAGDRIVLATGRPGFFIDPLPSYAARFVNLKDTDGTSASLSAKVNADASQSTVTVTRDAVDVLGPRRSTSLTLSDRQVSYPPITPSTYGGDNSDITLPVALVDPTAYLRSYVIALYQDYLTRTPAETEIQGWVDGLRNGSPRTSVAAGFVNSDEYRLDRIDAAYRTVLGREPDAGGRLNWLHGMQQGVLTPDDIETSFYASTEYFQRNGGSNPSWAAALYTTLLHRQGTASDYAFWGSLAAQHGRPWVIAQFWDSHETITERVTAMYARYLGREPDSNGLATWVGVALQLGDSGLRAALTSSDEYLARSQTLYPQQ